MSIRGLIPVLAAAATAVFASCARESAPSGGPVDRRPPVIVTVAPDTFARVEAGGGSIRIQFDEAISERPSGGTLAQSVQVSPRTGEVDVRHRGDALEVSIDGGFQPGVVYRVTVLPVVVDRFQNSMLDPFEWVFSTGPDFQPNAVAGEVWDRITGDPVPAMDVFAVGADSVRYVARTDSLGLFVMRFLPEAEYALRSYDDRNLNDEPDVFELQGTGGSLRVGAADTLFSSFWVMIPDTTAPQLAQGAKIDSTTLRLTFDDPLDPEQSLEGLVRGMYRDSGDTPGVLRALHEWEYEVWADSVREERAAIASAEAAAEGAAALEPPVDPQPAAEPLADTASVDAPPGVAEAAPGAGPVLEESEFLPDGQRVPERSVVLLLRNTIEGGDLYTVLLGPIGNISGIVAEESEGLFRLPADPRPPVRDTTAAPDTAAVPDTASIAPPPDSAWIGPPPDTLRSGGSR